ncbi:MAG: hypothetical protein M1829_005198 [Trizodia sp. TS-e1964]|nr:MAG: hypothetical protein M1829_005198 [Trizodia sp. TS-e1964]
MATAQIALTWVAYGIAVAILMLVSAIFVYTYQTPRDRSAIVSTVTIFTLTSLLATVLLLPVDIALVSSTSLSSQGRKKNWATPEHIHSILLTLKIVYYTLYSLDALLCLIVVPFTHFWYEEYDEVASEDGDQSFASRFFGALKYTLAFIILVVILFLVGFFVPIARDSRGGHHLDLDFFKKLLSENRGERALTFALGLLMTLGTILYVIYTAAGFALLPISFIKSAPSISAPMLAETTASALETNRERQRMLESRNIGTAEGMPTKDQRELEALIREERTLVRRERLAAEAGGQGKSIILKAWLKIQAVFRPLKLLGGILLLLVSIVIWVSMLITGIDKAKNSICKRQCGYILAHISIFQPINWIFVQCSKVFPVDYIIVTLLVLFFFTSSVVGIARIGIRFFWLRIFRIRHAHTSPQALLIAAVMLALIVLAINYSLAMIVAPQYATYGPQTFCTREPKHPGEQPDCSNHPEMIFACTELSEHAAAKDVCTPSVVSQFLNRITFNFPFFGMVDFWAQFAFLGVFLLVFVTALFRAPKADVDQLDRDAEEDEEEGLLASTGRRFGSAWEDITGHTRGSTGSGGRLIRDDAR